MLDPQLWRCAAWRVSFPVGLTPVPLVLSPLSRETDHPSVNVLNDADIYEDGNVFCVT